MSGAWPETAETAHMCGAFMGGRQRAAWRRRSVSLAALLGAQRKSEESALPAPLDYSPKRRTTRLLIGHELSLPRITAQATDEEKRAYQIALVVHQSKVEAAIATRPPNEPPTPPATTIAAAAPASGIYRSIIFPKILLNP